jgi:hypothetical protein
LSLFLLTFFLIYGGFHLYFFLKARSAFHFGVRTGIVLTLFMLLMVVTPVITRLSERAGLESIARSLSYIGYMWFALIGLLLYRSYFQQ